MVLQEVSGIEHKGHRISEHDIEQTFKMAADKLNENNFLQLSLNSQALGTEWKEINDTAGNESASNATAISLIFEHRPLLKRISWGVGASYYKVSTENILLKTLTLTLSFACVTKLISLNDC